MPAFHSFVVFAEMRTGSNLLEANLNALPGVTSHGEVFNRYILGKKDRSDLFGITLEERDRDPRRLLHRLRAETPGLAGFRFFHDHDLRILDDVLPDPACAKIILTRNPLESYVSWKIAQATDQWKLTNPKRLKTARVRFDVPEFVRHLRDIQAFQLLLTHSLQTTGQTAFYLDYEDLGSIEVMNGLAAFLGVEARLKTLDDTLKKQNPGALEDKLENPEAIAEAIAAVDVFNLGRTPSFEPRRAAGVPNVLASDAGLLFFPIRSGPEVPIRDWFMRLGDVTEGFEQKSLRHWKRKHPGHRSFTVLRHPLLRAHAAFRHKIVAGEAQDLQEMLGNLLDNACKWARSAVRLQVQLLPAGSNAAQPRMVVAVEDDGPGIDAAQRAQALERGVRLDEAVPGTGLGLAIVQELATLYGGRLDLQPAGLGGLRAALTLPAAISR